MNFIDKMVERFIKLNRRMKRWQRVVSVMAAVVVFVTTYALILPAITLDSETASTQAGIEVAASENESDEAGTVFESEAEEPTVEPAAEPAAEPAVVEEPEKAATDENSSVESGSEEAVVSDVPETQPIDEAEQTAVLATEETATHGTPEEAIAAVTGQTAEEVKLIFEDTQLIYEGSDYVVYADFGESAKLPEGVQLRVKEITKESDPEVYELYYQKALSEMQDKYDENTTLSFAKFYDIAFVYEDVEIEPSSNVNVRIEYKKAVEIGKTTTVDTIHFDKNDEEKAEVINSDTKGSEKEVEAVEFESDQFSVYGIVGTELVTDITLPGSDDTYEVHVTYGPEANIPKGSTLSVRSFDEGTEEYEYARKAVLADKKEKGESVNLNFFGFAALDISIIDPEGNEIEPEAPVQVELKIKSLPEVENLNDIKDTLEVQHHVETENGVIIEKVFNGSDKASFEQSTNEKVIEDKNNIVVDPDSVTEEDFKKNVDESDVETTFTTSYFSTYSVTWTQNWSTRSATVHYGYMNGNTFVEFPNGTPSYTPSFNNDYAFLIYDVEGYEYDSTHLGSATGTSIRPILNVSGNNHQYTTSTGSSVSWQNFDNGANIYVVYRAKTEPSQGGTPSPTTDETWPEGEDAPQFSKSSVNNGDGTNTISLSIEAAEKAVENATKANVVVVLDVSASMSDYMGNQTRMARARTAVNNMADTLLNKKDANGNKLVKMALVTFGGTANLVQGYTDNPTTFKNSVPTSANSGNSYLGATNWEQALYIANRLNNADADAATYVVFVTDGDPTFRMSRGEYTDAQLASEQANRSTFQPYRVDALYGYGAGTLNTNNNSRNFDAAVVEATSIINANKNLYAIGVSSDVTAVQNLVTQAGGSADNAILATNSSELTEAFEKIASSISSTLGFGDVEITDGITNLTNAEMKVMQEVDPDSFKYYKIDNTGEHEWTTREADGCAAASYNKETGAVEWNMGSTFQLEQGVTYKVTFKVWPKQEAYDLVAELNNGIKVYAEGQSNSITAAEREQVVELSAPTATAQGSYALKTNTDEINATYNKTTKSGSVVTISDTHDIEANYTEGLIQNMSLESMRLTVKKVFEDDLTAGEDRETEVVLVLKRRLANQETPGEFADYAVPQAGGSTSPNIVLNEGNNWTYSLYVAPGLKVDNEVLEHGYDFTITEPGIDYHYGLIEEIINPMVVDGEDVYYGDGELINGETIAQYTDQSLTAVNRVKSGIDIEKHVYDVDGTTEVYPDTEFTITGYIRDKDGNPYTFDQSWDTRTDKSSRIWSPASASAHQNDPIAYHKYDKDGNQTVYKGHFASTGAISFTLKAGERIRFINVPDGCTFQFTESTTGMDALGYQWMSTDAVTQHRTGPGEDFVTDGDVQPVVSGQTASLSTGVVGNKQYAITYGNKRTIALPDVEIVKVDAIDSDKKLNDAEFTLYSDAELTAPVTVDGNGNAISIKTGNKEGSDGPDGWYNIGLLPAGTYYLVETSEPTGYVLDETPVIITVTKETSSYTVTATKDGTSVISGPTEGVYTITVSNERATKYVKVFKYETGSNPEKALQGAQFTLTGPEGTDISYTNLTTNTDGYLVFGDNTYVELPVNNAAYTLTETKAPDGYNMMTENVVFTVTTGGVTGTGTGYTVVPGTETIDDAEVSVYIIKVQNSAGVELPHTGGPGTLPYTLGGIALIMASALMYGFRMRRRERRLN